MEEEKMEEESSLTKAERSKLKNERKKERKQLEKREQNKKKLINLLVWGTSIGLVIFGIGWLSLQRKNLPPTVMQGHIEESPESHILKTPMRDVIQRHMLEHADGGDVPSRIIQYNCEKYTCADDLVEKLEAFANEYTKNVYVAPNTYDGKIILTKLGKLQILDAYDEETIRNFILER